MYIFRYCISFEMPVVLHSLHEFLLSSLEFLEVIIHPPPPLIILEISIGIRARHSLRSTYFGLTTWSVVKNVVCRCSLGGTDFYLQWEGLSLLEGKNEEEHHGHQLCRLGSCQEWCKCQSKKCYHS